MSVYLKDIPLSRAQEQLYAALASVKKDALLDVEHVALDDTVVGRVLAEPVWARISSPHYHASAMDGFAVRSSSTQDAQQTSPVTLRYGDESEYVDTGDPLPEWADAVIPIENVEPLRGDGQISGNPRRPHSIRIRAATPPWKHVRPMGEDMVSGQFVLPQGRVLRPVDLGAIAAAGHDRVAVSRKPVVAILPTGTELVPVGQPVHPGEILEYNSIMLAAQISEWGGIPKRYPITEDNFEKLVERVEQAAGESDLVLINAGSSAGEEDFSAQVVGKLGELLVHGVAVRPGHPVIIGMLRKGHTPIIGVPGYPVSAALTGEIFVEPLLSTWLGRKPLERSKLQAEVTRKLTSPGGDDDYMRVAVGMVGDRYLAAPLSRGAGVISSLVQADGIVVLPAGVQGLPAGSKVDVRLYRPLSDIESTIFAIGSHDMSLDLLAQDLAIYDRRLVSANAGSMGGLIALQRGEAHLAGSHLLDPQSGEYNHSYIQKYLPGRKIHLVTLVERSQGLITLQDNPKQITSLEDLVRQEIVFVNRQRGAGTRVLLDYQLDKMGLSPAHIAGYENEEFTHLAVAAAVASGRADCGLGIAAAANALGLDFIPLYSERYDLVIPSEFYESELLSPLLSILKDPEFRASVARLPGYGVDKMGEIVETFN